MIKIRSDHSEVICDHCGTLHVHTANRLPLLIESIRKDEWTSKWSNRLKRYINICSECTLNNVNRTEKLMEDVQNKLSSVEKAPWRLK